MKKVNLILWIVYIALLAVLLPHTAFSLSMFEPVNQLGKFSSYALAFAFEAAIAALTYKLSERIETPLKRVGEWKKFKYRYLNFFSFGLVGSVIISSMANLSHAVEFARPMKIFTEWGIPFGIYAVAFGAVLPMISFTFAWVLSDAVDTESEDDPALSEANKTITELRRELRDVRSQLTASQQRFDAMGDVFVRLMGEDKRERILAASQLWPGLPGKYIAVVADSTPSYVSEVING